MTSDGLADHGVLAHENDGESSQGTTDLLQLLGSDIVCADNEALRILIEKLLDIKHKLTQIH